MKVVQALLLVFFLVFTTASETDKKYTTKYDNVDLEELVKNERLLKNYMECLLEKGPCTPDGLELRNTMPDAIETDCSKCSEKQKEGSDFLMQYLIDNKPDMWQTLETKYDPTGEYRRKYLASHHQETTTKRT